MVDRPSTATMRRRMYVPEERPDYESYIADPENQRLAEEAAMNLIALGMGPMGEIPAGLRLARNVLGGARLANKGEQLLPRPDRGNAMRPEEMLTPEPQAPWLAADQNRWYPTKYNTKDNLLPKPQRPQMTEEEMQAMEIARMVGEGGPSFSKQEAARREVRRRPSEEEMRANEVARMESEGGMDPELAALLRTIKEDRERAAHAEDLARFEGEGGGAWTYTGPRYKYGLPATQGSREVMPFNAGAREMIPYGSSSSVPTFAGGRGGMDLLTPSYRFAEGQEALMPPAGGGRLPPPSGGAAPGASVPPSSGGFTGFQTKVPYGGEAANFALGDMPGSVGALTRSVPPFAFSINEEVNKLKAQRQAANTPAQTQAPAVTPEDLFDMRNAPAPVYTPADLFDMRSAPAGKGSPARSSGAPAPAPAAKQSTGADIRALWENYNKSGEAADFIRADKAMQEARKAGIDLGLPTAQGEKRGGSVEKKPDAVHKALEIIHHLVTR
ncbi:MAG: hypothetical protein AMJ56_00400 [Anaerolineae bacterium SG8_19]|nr:MAG: hypothetical protein AMJ56_00400 [Anaerolineae bacterium SG8_19]